MQLVELKNKTLEILIYASLTYKREKYSDENDATDDEQQEKIFARLTTITTKIFHLTNRLI